MSVIINGVQIGSTETGLSEVSTGMGAICYSASEPIAMDNFIADARPLTDQALLAYFTTKIYPSDVVYPTSATVVSKAHTAVGTNDDVLITAKYNGTVTISVSRDNGTTWTVVTPEVPADISAQPAGTAMRVKYVLGASAVMDDYALFWK